MYITRRQLVIGVISSEHKLKQNRFLPSQKPLFQWPSECGNDQSPLQDQLGTNNTSHNIPNCKQSNCYTSYLFSCIVHITCTTEQRLKARSSQAYICTVGERLTWTVEVHIRFPSKTAPHGCAPLGCRFASQPQDLGGSCQDRRGLLPLVTHAQYYLERGAARRRHVLCRHVLYVL